MPSTSRCGVDSALPKVSRPVLSSNTAMSVKVPPMSAASRMLAPLSARGFGADCHGLSNCLSYCFFIAACAIGRPALGFATRVSTSASCVRRQRLRVEGVLLRRCLSCRHLQIARWLLIEPLATISFGVPFGDARARTRCWRQIVAELLEGRHARRYFRAAASRWSPPARAASALHLAERRAPGERAHRHAAGRVMSAKAAVL